MHPPLRLIGAQAYHRLCRRAARRGPHGAAAALARLWLRVVRAARALGRSDRLPGDPSGFPHAPAPVASRRTPRGFPVTLTTPTVKVRMDRGIAEGLIRSSRPQLVIDLSRQRAMLDGKVVGLEGQRMLLGIACGLMRASGGPVRVEELFAQVWGRAYRGGSDLGTLQFHVSALRSRLAAAAPGVNVVASWRGELALARGLSWVLIEPASAPGTRLMDERDLLEVLAERRFIDNRGLRELRGSSRMTALRQLRALVATGHVVREGKGRGARYRVAGDRRAMTAS